MRLRIMSHRGDHAAEVADSGVARLVFEKLTGVRAEALDRALLGNHLPTTFEELEELWRPGPGARAAFDLETRRKLEGFDPEARAVMFVPPITGG